MKLDFFPWGNADYLTRIDRLCHSLDNGNVAPSFNGRTPASGAGYRGSNPWGAAKTLFLLGSRRGTNRCRRRYGALHPCRVPQIQEDLGSGGEAVGGELERFRRSLFEKASSP